MEENKTAVEDLGETGPIGYTPVDLNKTPRSELSKITRMGLALLAMSLNGTQPIPAVTPRNKIGSAKGLIPAPNHIPSRSGGRVKRNEPCHCGSGKKFSKCCLPKLKRN